MRWQRKASVSYCALTTYRPYSVYLLSTISYKLIYHLFYQLSSTNILPYSVHLPVHDSGIRQYLKTVWFYVPVYFFLHSWEAGTCEEGPLESLTWCTLESSRGKNGLHSCTGLLYFDSGIFFIPDSRGVGAWNFEICVPRIFSRISLEDMRARICVASSHASSHIICVLAYCFIVVGVFWFSVKSVSPSSVRTKNDPYKLTINSLSMFNI